MSQSSNFVDYVKICCRSGHGGAGSSHLHRDILTSKGGPDGGDGGRGGHIIVKGSSQLWTLLHLKYRKHIIAENGFPGSSGQKSGRTGIDEILEIMGYYDGVGQTGWDKETQLKLEALEEKDGFKTITRTFVSFDGQTKITSSESSLVIEETKKRLMEIEKEIKAAVKNENYERAAELKKEKEQLTKTKKSKK